MTFQHILEPLIEGGIFKKIIPENGKAYGVRAAAEILGRKLTCSLKNIWERCESPIETAMAAALCYAEWPCTVEIEPQHIIGRYRLDFLVSGSGHRINVECDGEQFHHHDISMEQYQADRARDRLVELEGISVIRFRGSQIWVDAIGCADEVAALLRNLISEGERSGD